MHLLNGSTDLQFVSMLFKLQQVVISSTLILEKLPEEMGVLPYCDKFILPILQQKWLSQSDSLSLNVKINAIQTFNNILKSDTKFERLGEQYFRKHGVLYLI